MKDGDPTKPAKPLLEISGVKMILDSIEIAAFLEQNGARLGGMIPQGATKAPNGWLPLKDATAFFPELSADLVPRLLRGSVGAPQDSHPKELSRHYRKYFRRSAHGPLRNLVEHVDKAVIEDLRDALDVNIPEGWTLFDVVEITGLPKRKVQEILARLVKGGKRSDYDLLLGKISIVSLDLVRRARELAARRYVIVPEQGWMTGESVHEQFPDRTRRDIKASISVLLKQQTVQSKIFTDPRSGEKIEHYPPQIIATLNAEPGFRRMDSNMMATWITVAELNVILEKLKLPVRAFVGGLLDELDPARTDHRLVPMDGTTKTKLSPELADKLVVVLTGRKRKEQGKNVPSGMTRVDLGKDLKGVPARDYMPLVEKFVKAYPRDFIVITADGKRLDVSDWIVERFRQEIQIAKLKSEDWRDIKTLDLWESPEQQQRVEVIVHEMLEDQNYADGRVELRVEDSTVVLLNFFFRTELKRRTAKEIR